jgi:O-antigen/teichoic acid export membrane protein
LPSSESNRLNDLRALSTLIKNCCDIFFHLALAKTIALSVGARAAQAIFALGTLAVLRRQLGAEEFGLYITVWSAVQWFALANFGVNNVLTNKMTYALAESKSEGEGEFWRLNMLGLRFNGVVLVGLIVCGLMIVVFAPTERWLAADGLLASAQVSIACVLALVAFALTVIGQAFMPYWTARQELSRLYRVQLLGFLLGGICLWLVVRLQGGFAWTLSAALFPPTLGVILLALWDWWRAMRSNLPTVSWREVLALTIQGRAFVVIQIAALILYGMDAMVLAHFVSLEDAGVFSAVNRLYVLGVALVTASFAPLYPQFCKAYVAGNQAEIVSKLRHLLGLAAALAFGLAMSSFWPLPELLGLWLNLDEPVSRALLLASAAMVGARLAAEAYAQVVVASNRAGLHSWVAGMMTIVYAPLVIIAVLWLGPIGLPLALFTVMVGALITFEIVCGFAINRRNLLISAV